MAEKVINSHSYDNCSYFGEFIDFLL